MCIGMPMQVEAVLPGHARVAGRGETRLVNTALVGDVRPGDWLLIFIDGAREHISAARAAEVNATLDLIEDALHGGSASNDPGFVLPSSYSAAQMAALAGAAPSPSNDTTNTADTPDEH